MYDEKHFIHTWMDEDGYNASCQCTWRFTSTDKNTRDTAIIEHDRAIVHHVKSR